MTRPSVLRRTFDFGGHAVQTITGPDALAELPAALASTDHDQRHGTAPLSGRAWIVADERAWSEHGSRFAQVLPESPRFEMSGAETSKTLDQAAAIWDWLIREGVERHDVLVAFGGGVVCDLVGFVAACYLRGIRLVNVPTTLLAQVDASIGGKTGVNHRLGKNLIGAFHHASTIIADTSVLASLDGRAFAGGLAEVAKVAMALDADFFTQLEQQAPLLRPDAADLLGPIVDRAIGLKAEIVRRDERESGDRMLLNYGHTLGHALEAAAEYRGLLHGEAVAVGMEAAARIARAMGMLTPTDADRQTALLEALHLPTHYAGAKIAEVLPHLSVDKKRRSGVQRWVLAERVGKAVVRDDVPDRLVIEAASAVLESGPRADTGL